MRYVYIFSIVFWLKPELCERNFVYSLSLPTNVPTHYQQDCCWVICGTRAPSAKTFVGLVLHELLFMGPVSLLAIFAFWWCHLWPTILNTPLQKDTFVPQNTLNFYFHWVFVLLVLRSVGQGLESLVTYFDDGQVHDFFPNNIPYWVFLASTKNEIVPNFLYLGYNGTSYPCSWYIFVGLFCWSLPPPWYCLFVLAFGTVCGPLPQAFATCTRLP